MISHGSMESEMPLWMRRSLAAAAVLAVSLLSPVTADAQAAAVPACTLKNGVYTCDNVAFQQDLRNARTVRIEVGRIDRIARAQLEDLVAKLGKTVSDEGAADLTFTLTAPDHNEVNVLPGDADLGTLRVYATGTDGQRQLVWAETYRGRTDLPWPSVVHMVIRKFERHFLTQ